MPFTILFYKCTFSVLQIRKKLCLESEFTAMLIFFLGGGGIINGIFTYVYNGHLLQILHQPVVE